MCGLRRCPTVHCILAKVEKLCGIHTATTKVFQWITVEFQNHKAVPPCTIYNTVFSSVLINRFHHVVSVNWHSLMDQSTHTIQMVFWQWSVLWQMKRPAVTKLKFYHKQLKSHYYNFTCLVQIYQLNFH